jgi:hypothetical protein
MPTLRPAAESGGHLKKRAHGGRLSIPRPSALEHLKEMTSGYKLGGDRRAHSICNTIQCCLKLRAEIQWISRSVYVGLFSSVLITEAVLFKQLKEMTLALAITTVPGVVAEVHL